MPLQPIQFAAQSYQGRTGVVDLERLVNLYLEANPATAKSPVTIYGTPGLRRWATIGSGPCRGMQRMGAYLYVVSGTELYRVGSDGASTLLGVIPGTGNVFTCENGTHVGVACNAETFACDASGVIALGLSGVVGAAAQDGMGIFAVGGGEQFWATDPDDMTTIGGTSFSSADVFSDQLVGCISDHRDLVLFGERSVEFWYNSGASPFPFSRTQGGFIERGCAASGSIAKADRRVYWLGDDLAIYRNAGYQAERISTPSIERLIEGASDPHSAHSWTYRQEGHVHYVLNFSDLTICYDTTTGLWHERVSSGLSRWRANCHERIWDQDLVGDCENGDIYELDLDYYTDDGDSIVREAVAPPLHAGDGESLVSMSRLVVDLETGVGIVAGQGSNPVLLLDWSDDGGATWSNERQVTIGAIGARRWRALAARLGAFRNRSLRVRISDPVKVAILGASAQLEVTR